ncbi:hypothetical protein BCR36DRAFT_578893 [Piromyces finnis]|uniref:Zf-UBP-domain-containing protein n=1 Tax=Piromyces finnis TaxID=1754191 RepID=A0A1Y1VNG1_9FUNG|nr:hypothetical protein BCR36DRAFT_578893 [Piromyces finnis]|eukprot:ORX60820.1 hypothetical protein BCR36DRAFT_578893 [Piromyces finnis]
MVFYQLKFELFNSKNQSFQFIPNNIFEPISNIEKYNIKKNNTANNKELSFENNKFDFRLGPINIEWIDMENKVLENGSSKSSSTPNSTNNNNNNNNNNSISINKQKDKRNISSEKKTSTISRDKNNNDVFIDATSGYSKNNSNLSTNSKNNLMTNNTALFTINNSNASYELERQQYIKINEKKIKKHGFIPVSGGFIPYSSVNTKFEIGILHLYRGITKNNIKDQSPSNMDNYSIEDTNEISPDIANSLDPSDMDNSKKQPMENSYTSCSENIKKYKIVCVLAVPSYMSTIDFLNFVGPIRKYVSHFRIINDTLPNRFMVLMMFRKSKYAYDFVNHYNGIQFNSLEPETCHAVFIEKIEFQAMDLPSHLILFPDNPIAIEDLKKIEKEKSQQKQHQQHFSNNKNDSQKSLDTNNTLDSTSSLQKISSSDGILTSYNLSNTNANESTLKNKDIIISSSGQNNIKKAEKIELPICPVCLERMDSSVTGLLTILCQHTFHCHCLSKWKGSTCPVCRYSQKSFLGTDQQNECSSCQSTENLWICLICGNIGCGRYQQAHAYEHFLKTNHLYSLEIETQRVWDYAGDGYVHRLIQNKIDGKLVELPSPAPFDEDSQSGLLQQQQQQQQQQQNQQQLANNMLTEINNKKINYLSTEYNDLLTSQLESQKFYFENQIEDMKKVFNVQLHNLSDYYENINMKKNKEISELNEKLQYEFNQNQNLEKEKSFLLKEKKTMEKKIERSESLKKDYQEEKVLTKMLLENQNKLKILVDEKDKEINDLKEQVRDLMFYLDAKSKVENCENKEEIQNGTIIISEESSTSSKKKKKTKNKKKK